MKKKRRNKKLTKILTDRVSKVMNEDAEEIARLERDGHSYHCACRLVWGDGECECKKGEKVESYTHDHWNESTNNERK